MLTFRHLEGMISVMANFGEKVAIPIGVIDKNAFFTAIPTTYSSQDLYELAKKTAETRRYGINPPICPDCDETPFFPNLKLTTAYEVTEKCSNEIHQIHFADVWLPR